MFLISMIVSISLLQFCFTRILNLELVVDVAECNPSSCADDKSSDTRLVLQTVKRREEEDSICENFMQTTKSADCWNWLPSIDSSRPRKHILFLIDTFARTKFPIFNAKIVWRWTAYSSGCQSGKVSLLDCSCLIQHFSIRLKEPIFFRFKIVWHILWKILNLILLQRNSSNRNYFEFMSSREEFENKDAEAI